MFNRKLLRNLDFTLIALVLVIFTLGLVMIATATNVNELGLTRQVKIQFIGFIIGTVMLLCILAIDYNTFGDFYKSIYVISILFLLSVYIPGLGIVRNNARSWINLGIIDLQTSEIAKIGFILSYAKFLELRKGQLNTIKDLIGPVAFILPFLLLLLKQPDLGSALVFLSIAFGMLYVSGLNYKIIFAGIVGAVVSLPLIYKMMKPHQRIRIDAYLNPQDLSLPGNYHVFQSKITIGSGGVYGKGLFMGQYHRYDYLPVQETDFIYAVLGEELGFVGGAVVIALYFMFLMRMLTISRKSKDLYGSLVAVGITFMFAFQIIENIGMTMGVMPVTGVTLPFISYGGSSVITSLLSIGLLLNVYMRRKRISFSL
ncbi:MAG: rod shape-determining protein RodA [Firmicutes bacterium]|jgi:rod shape determining protein RodA|nr:rod shape-determining protein RodA [Bacillota bacterium]